MVTIVDDNSDQVDEALESIRFDALKDTDRNVLGDSICTLVDQARNGCISAKSELVEQLQTYLTIVAKSRLNAKFQAKFGESDVVQQSIAIAIEKFDDFRGNTEGELFGWARTILNNEVLQQQRSLLSDKRNMFRERPFVVSDGSTCFNHGLTDTQLTPKTNAISKEQSLVIAKAIGRLPEDYQRVILLRNTEELPFSEIGKRMDKSENAVTKLWFRALVQLRKELSVDDL